MLTTTIIESIRMIPESTWNSIVLEDHLHMKYEYLKTLETSLKNMYSFYYLLVYKHGELVAATPLFINCNFYLDTPVTGKLKSIIFFSRKISSNFLKKKALFCGCPISEFNCINIRNDYITEGEEILNIIIREMEHFAKKNKIKVIAFKDLKCKCLNRSEVLEKSEFLKIYSLPGTKLDINFTYFDDYLKSLKKKYRANVKNKINKSKKCGNLEIEIIEDFIEYIPEIYNVYKNTYEKAQYKFEKLSIDFFYNLKDNLKKDVVCILCKVDDKVCGATILVNSEDVCINLRIGLDYQYAHKYNLYFLMLYKNIEYAIESKKSSLLLSQTSYRPKIELGANTVPLVAYIKFEYPVFGKVYTQLTKHFFKKYELLATSEKPLDVLKEFFPQYYN